MRILVCGDRNFTDYELLCDVLQDYNSDKTVIIEGGASGADSLARQWAIERYIDFKEYPADWEKYGKAAGPIRNKQMLDEGKPELVITFLAKDSKGTKNMIEQATKANVPVKMINI